MSADAPVDTAISRLMYTDESTEGHPVCTKKLWFLFRDLIK